MSNDYVETRLDLTPYSDTAADIAAQMLADVGYESFVASPTGIIAYVARKDYSPGMALRALNNFPLPNIDFSADDTIVPGRDWNAEWEKNYFKPIVIDGQCVVHSSFHTDLPQGLPYDIVIDPKMAFGTGHHATTTLIMKRLLATDMHGQQMLDMGTGTGILAILAAMRGARAVTAIEIDPPAWENAVANTALNGHSEIETLLGDASLLYGRDGRYTLVTANINRNIVTADMGAYARAMAPGANIFLSGFYQGRDAEIVAKAGQEAGLLYIDTTVLDNWACVNLRKP